ncbi:MAG: hypothetical protein ACLQFR_08230 [Streptosporangiaceae bacterium]
MRDTPESSRRGAAIRTYRSVGPADDQTGGTFAVSECDLHPCQVEACINDAGWHARAGEKLACVSLGE